MKQILSVVAFSILVFNLKAQTIGTEAPSVSSNGATIRPGDLQIESFLGMGRNANYSFYNLPSGTIRAGLSKNFEARVSSNNRLIVSYPYKNTSYSNLSFSLKGRIINKENTNVALIPFYDLSIVNPSENNRFGLNLAFDHSFDKHNICANLGGTLGNYVIENELTWTENNANYSLCYTYKLNDRAYIFGEYFGNYYHYPHQSIEGNNSGIDVGFQFLVTDRIQLDYAVGQGINLGTNEIFHRFGFNILIPTNGN